LAAYEAEKRAATNEPYFLARYSYEDREPGVRIVTFRSCPDDDHVEEYVYAVSADGVVPRRMTRYFGPARSFSAMRSIMVAALSITIGVCCSIRWRRIKNPPAAHA
jgi:hypothetical protein